MLAEVAPEHEERVPETGAGLGIARVTPEERGEHVARVADAGSRGQIGE